jgi:hypothetical protein
VLGLGARQDPHTAAAIGKDGGDALRPELCDLVDAERQNVRRQSGAESCESVDDIFSSPYRVASAPNSSTSSSGSIPVPSDLDMRRPSGAWTVEWIRTSENGMSSMNSIPIITIIYLINLKFFQFLYFYFFF